MTITQRAVEYAIPLLAIVAAAFVGIGALVDWVTGYDVLKEDHPCDIDNN